MTNSLPTSRSISRFLLFFVVLATIVWAFALAIQFWCYRIVPSPPSADCKALPKSHAALVDLELACSSHRFTCLIGPESSGVREHNLDLLQCNTDMDCLYIPLYWCSFLLFAWQFRNRLWLAATLALAITVAAVCDYVEDFRLFGAVQAMRHGDPDFPVPGIPSAVKWLFLGLSMLLLAALLSRVPGFWHRTFAILVGVAGAGTLVGILKQEWHELIGLALLFLLSAMVLSLFLYWPGKNKTSPQTSP
jgi:hypothetical protein